MRRVLLLAASIALAAPCAAAEVIPGSVAGDSLLMPTETFVLTREDLIERNIHTLDDIIELLPGVALWREGPDDARDGFSIDGRGSRGMNLLVNGLPCVDGYTMESLTRFLPLSRLRRVEVVYSGSPCFSGDLSSRGFINVVLEEDGREGPTSAVDFTYGAANRRARRAWFATPRAHVSAAVAYDEYLQDAVEAYLPIPGRLLGKDDMRSILAELSMRTADGDEVVFRLHRFEDTYVGTAYSAAEDARRSGFESEMSARHRGLSLSLTQRVLDLSRVVGAEHEEIAAGSERTVAGRARWQGGLGALSIRAFAAAERAEFREDLVGTRFEPTVSRVEGGLTVGGFAPSRVTWRLGGFGGDHGAVGRYAGAEIAIAKGWSDRVSQDVIVARRLRVPSAQELFQRTPPGTITAAGDPDLSCETADELSIGLRLPAVSLSVFGRDERSLIVLSGDTARVYRPAGSGKVAGVRAGCRGARTILGVDCSLAVDGEGYPERGALGAGVPEYRLRGSARLARRVFSETELLSIVIDSELAGARRWPEATLGAYHVLDAAACLTIMSARVSFEYKNILNERYETIPGYTMSPAHWIIGVFWELFD
jgi:hypothetical protein